MQCNSGSLLSGINTSGITGTIISTILWVCLLLYSANSNASTQLNWTQIKVPLTNALTNNDNWNATLRLPRNLNPQKKLPLILVFGGFENAGKVLDLFHSDFPVALASFNYPYSPKREFQFPESLYSLPELKLIFPRTLEGIRVLTKRLIQRPEIDSSKVIIIGASFGSPFALAAGAEIPEVAGIVAVHGFGDPVKTLENVILRSWVPKYGWPARPAAWLLSRLGWEYLKIPPPEYWAERLTSHQKVLMVTAEGDTFIPRSSSDALWSALRESKAASKRILMPTDHLMPGAEHLIQEIVLKIQHWMQEEQLS